MARHRAHVNIDDANTDDASLTYVHSRGRPDHRLWSRKSSLTINRKMNFKLLKKQTIDSKLANYFLEFNRVGRLHCHHNERRSVVALDHALHFNVVSNKKADEEAIFQAIKRAPALSTFLHSLEKDRSQEVDDRKASDARRRKYKHLKERRQILNTPSTCPYNPSLTNLSRSCAKT